MDAGIENVYKLNMPMRISSVLVPGSAIPCRPWVLSKQYSMTFVLSQDNEIILGDAACRYLGDAVLRYIIAAVNAYSPNAWGDLPPLSELKA